MPKPKPMNVNELEKIELCSDGRNAERFEALTRKIVTVPKKEIEEREKKAAKSESRTKRS